MQLILHKLAAGTALLGSTLLPLTALGQTDVSAGTQGGLVAQLRAQINALELQLKAIKLGASSWNASTTLPWPTKLTPKDTQTCVRAFGRLVAPGLKAKVDAEGSKWCGDLPPGIAKKLGKVVIPPPAHSTTTLDTTAPRILNIMTDVRASSTVLFWVTNEVATSTLYYSPSNPVVLGSATTTTVTADGRFGGRVHTLEVGNLATSTTYYGVIQARDKSGNIGLSQQFSFRTM